MLHHRAQLERQSVCFLAAVLGGLQLAACGAPPATPVAGAAGSGAGSSSATGGAAAGGSATGGASGTSGASGASGASGLGGTAGTAGSAGTPIVSFPTDPAAYANLLEVISVDSKQSVAVSNWTARPTRVLRDTSMLPAVPVDVYGGMAATTGEKTGFFHVEKQNGRWWMVTPEGHRYFYAAINSTRPNLASNNESTFATKFGGDAAWAEATTTLLRDNAFYGTASWSNDEALRGASSPPNYALILNFTTSYASAKGIGSHGTGHYDFPGNVLPIFNADFVEFCKQHMQSYASVADDPRLVGYFTDNELPFSKSSLSDYLNAPEGDASGDAARTWLSERHPDAPTTIQATDGQDFLTYLVDRYFSKVTEAIRSVDEHHMVLGSRFYGGHGVMDLAAWQGAAAWVDVISINWYIDWSLKPELSSFAAAVDRPFMVTEFYTKGMDSGLANNSGAGWVVPTQADRGAYYQNIVLELLQSGYGVGAHWLGYMDNNPLGTGDPSNKDSNKGIVTVQFEPYSAVLDRMRLVNTHVYGIVAGMQALGLAP